LVIFLLSATVLVVFTGCAGYVDRGLAGPAYIEPYPGPDVYVYGDVGQPVYGDHYQYWHRGIPSRHYYAHRHPENVGGFHGSERGHRHYNEHRH
jgi:hypothetical protein